MSRIGPLKNRLANCGSRSGWRAGQHYAFTGYEYDAAAMGPRGEGRGGNKLGWGHTQVLDKAEPDQTKTQHTQQSTS